MKMNNCSCPHMGMDMMKMYFHVGLHDTILFKDWKVDSIGELIGSMIGFIILGILYEGLKAGRDKLKQRNAVRNKGIEDHSRPQSNSLHDYHSDGYSDEQTPLVKGATPAGGIHCLRRSHVLQAFLHVVQVFFGYVLMLAFMVYNWWICIAILVGAFFGYLFFGWRTELAHCESEDHCN